MTAGAATVREPSRPDRRLSLDYLTVAGATPVEQIEAAAAAGFDSVGLRFLSPSDLELEHEVVDDPAVVRAIGRACRRAGVTPLDVEVFFLTPQPDMARFVRAAGIAAEVGASRLLAVSADPDRARAIDRFGALCDVAATSGMEVALEFMRWSPVATVDDAVSFVADAGRPNAGVCVDALHLSRSGGSPATLPPLPHPGSFIQLCDARAAIPPADQLLAEARNDRLHPGQGELWLEDLVAAVPSDMPISVEVPDRRHADRSVLDRALIAGAGLRAFLATGHGSLAAS